MLNQDVVRRLSIVATETGLTSVNTKLREHERLQAQVTAGAARMSTATETADRRMQALLRQRDRYVTSFNQGGLAGVGATAGGSALGAAAPYAVVGAGVIATIAAMNAVYERGAELLEKYANAQRELDRPDLKENLASLTALQQETISAAQVQYATELGVRLQDAKFTIDQFFKVHLDITDPALRLQSIWVSIVETIAQGVSKGEQLIAVTAKASGPAAAAGLIPGVGGAAVLANRAYDYFNPPPAAPTREQELAAARARLGAAMGVRNIGEDGAPIGDSFTARFGASIYGLSNPRPKEDKQRETVARRDEFDRVTDSIRKQTEALNIQVETFGMSTEAAARYKIEQQLINAATAAGRELTDEQRATISATADAYAQAAARLEEMRKAQERVEEINNALRDTFKGFVSDIRSGLQEGMAFWDSFQKAAVNALNRISDKLMDMAINQLWQQAFPTKGGGGGFLAGLFGGGSSIGGASSSYMMGGVSVPLFHGGGVVGQSAVAQRFVHPAYFENAPRFHSGGEVPALLMPGEEVLTRNNPRHRANGGGQSYQDNRVFNIDARGATVDAIAALNRKIDQVKAEGPQMTIATVAHANRHRPSVIRPR